jgi:hypothetical protein
MVVSPHNADTAATKRQCRDRRKLAEAVLLYDYPLHEWEAVLVEWGVISMIFPQRCPRHCGGLSASAISIQTGVIARPFAGHQQPRHHSQCRGFDRNNARYCQEMIA